MQLSSHSGDVQRAQADLIAIGVVADDGLGKGKLTDPQLRALDKSLGGELGRACADQEYKGERQGTLLLPTFGKLPARWVCLIGVGKAEDIRPIDLLNLGGIATRQANHVGAAAAVLVLPGAAAARSSAVEQVARGAVLGGYKFGLYRDKGRKSRLQKLSIAAAVGGAQAEKQLSQGQVVAEGAMLARDLVNQSPLELYPASFAAVAQKVARQVGLGIKVLGPKELERRKMGLLLGVGQGSSRPPHLVHLSYSPKGAAKGGKARKPIVLVGKGITFDSGGLDLKSAENMLEMKTDMAGAAAVLATMQVIARLAPKVPVHGILALAENMPSGTAIRPGDVLRAANGRTVEINNTDAEGRLVLGDAIHYALDLAPARIIDLATLTGACMIALGPTTAGLFSNDDSLAGELLACADDAGESMWRMPLLDELKEQLKSDIADTKNTGERYGGAITAALFLREFVAETPWAHLDIAGPSTSRKDGGMASKGGSGVGVATLTRLICG